MNTAIEGILRNISKQLEEIKKSNVTVIERCAVNNNGDPLKIFGIVSMANGFPEIKWYFVDGTQTIQVYDGAIIPCT